MIYFFDGTKEAFFTAFLAAWGDKDAVLTCGQKQLVLGMKTVFVNADSRAARAEARFETLDKGCLHELDFLLRSGEQNRGQIAFRYFRRIAETGGPVRGRLHEDDVIAAAECVNRVGLEIHRLHGFVRFLACESGALYSPVTPDNDICDLLVPHFRARLEGYPFVIHDIKRKKAAVYDGEHTFLAPLDRADVALSADEIAWQELWKTYYRGVNIPSRERLKQMRGYMPVRYWKHLTELNGTEVSRLQALAAAGGTG